MPRDPSARDDDDVALYGAPNANVPAWVAPLAHALDDAFLIPGTRIRIGADAIVGFFFPAAGDAVTGIVAVTLLFAAWRSGVPTVVLARMVMNTGIDAVVGAVPIVGDIFDVAWRSNRMNVALLRAHATQAPRDATLADSLIVAAGVLVALAVFVIPIAVLVVVFRQFGA